MKNKEAKEVEIKGNKLSCPVCGHSEFWTRKTLLNTPGVTFFGFDWMNKTSKNYVCDNCSHILWFFEE